MSRALDGEFRAVLTEMDPNFDWRLMPSVKELSGESMETFVDQAQQNLAEKKKKREQAAFDEFESVA